jgi:YVTN family beta-propeller protein
MRMGSKVSALLLLSLLAQPAGAQQQRVVPAGEKPREVSGPANLAEQAQAPQRIIREGIAVDFTMVPRATGKTPGLIEGAEATVVFKITDNSSGQPLSRLHPSAWMDLRGSAVPSDKSCREKIQSFLQASPNKRADLDLNTYFILTLNQEPNISVIDPLSGFGGSKLYTLVNLQSRGEDWLMTRDQRRLFVTTPQAGQVAVIDTADWKVIATIDAGHMPKRMALQRDERFLWVGNENADGSGGVTVIDLPTLKVRGHVATGDGEQAIAFTDDDRYAFVTNQQSGTVSIIDVPKLARIKDLKVGLRPSGLAFSSLSKSIYVINEGDGDVVAIDAQRHEVSSRIQTRAGLHAIRFASDGRFGFVVNRAESLVYIFDAATQKLLHTVRVGRLPDQISFTRNYAYVRSSGDEFVTMIALKDFAKQGAEATVTRFPAGQKAPQLSAFPSMADAVIAAPEDGAVLVANPADQTIYYYMEGMAAPMGTFVNYRRDPRALLVHDKSLRESAPGVYTTTVRLTGHGKYDVAFLLDSPRVVNCFDATVRENPEITKQRKIPIRIEVPAVLSAAYAGQTYRLRFKVIDSATNQPRSDLEDLGSLAFLVPGIWQQRQQAKRLTDGSYEIEFVPPQAGVYYVFFQSPSLGIPFNQLQRVNLHVRERKGSDP